MEGKKQIITTLREEFRRWEELLDGIDEEQITAPQLSGNWSIKDVIAHLWAWQQRSVARMEAAVHDKEPDFPPWPEEFDPEAEGQPHELNAWIYESYREKPWPRVHEDWRVGFHRLLALGEEIPEENLLEPGRYTWLEGQPLSLVLLASCEHHEEHRGWLVAWLGRRGTPKPVGE
jgi:hypothetical protein